MYLVPSRKDFPLTIRQGMLSVGFVLILCTLDVQADDRSDAERQVEFGITVAERGLWREATFRWQRAVAIDPTYAAAWNNLAVAHEHEGEFESALEAYERALALEPNNLSIQQNYELFREINDRTQP